MNKSELIKTLAETKDLHIDEAADIVNAFMIQGFIQLLR